MSYDHTEHPWKEPMPIGRFAVNNSDVDGVDSLSAEVVGDSDRYCLHTDMLFDDFANNAEEIMDARMWRK